MRARWINAETARYYKVDLVQDLFGDWTLVQCWGGIGSRRGGQRIVWVPSYQEGLERIEMLGKRRQQRGYVEVTDPTQEAEILRLARETPSQRRVRKSNSAQEDLLAETT